MVHFPEFARTQLCIHWAVLRFYRSGFPHSDIPESKPACGSSRLIAACHVLHRHLLPRHPPCALSNLTIKFTQSTQHSAVSNQLLSRDIGISLTAKDRIPGETLRPYGLLIADCRLHRAASAPAEISKVLIKLTLRLCSYTIYSVVKYRLERPKPSPPGRLVPVFGTW